MCLARRDPHRWLAKEALAQQSQVATGSSRDIPPLIRKAGKEPGVDLLPVAAAIPATTWITPLGDTLGSGTGSSRRQTRWRGRGKSTGMEGKFTGVQPKLSLEEQRSDKKERGIAMDMTPRDSSSFLQSVQGAGHIKKEERSPKMPTA